MNKFQKTVALMTISALFAVSFTSCEKPGDTTEEANKETKDAIIKQYLEHTVYPTYTQLATQTEKLVESLETLKASLTQTHLNAATETFLEARHWWEMSEAFLFGAASDFGIDPHIDSWPLDEDAFNNLMASPNMIAMLDTEDGDVVAGEQLGNALLGFHGIEYILFRDGQPRSVDEVTNDMMIYAVAVAGDLRNRCCQLEVSWSPDASQAHKALMEELEFNTTVNGSNNSYGDNMILAGQAGSTYASRTNALQAILDGCITISDEVGSSKIGKPHTGADPNYVESPYSHQSIRDFADNITSIQNAYMGGIAGQRDEDLSVHHFIKDFNAELDTRIVDAINNAINKINVMKAPFVSNYSDPTAGEAMEACLELSEVLDEAKSAMNGK